MYIIYMYQLHARKSRRHNIRRVCVDLPTKTAYVSVWPFLRPTARLCRQPSRQTAATNGARSSFHCDDEDVPTRSFRPAFVPECAVSCRIIVTKRGELKRIKTTRVRQVVRVAEINTEGPSVRNRMAVQRKTCKLFLFSTKVFVLWWCIYFYLHGHDFGWFSRSDFVEMCVHRSEILSSRNIFYFDALSTN